MPDSCKSSSIFRITVGVLWHKSTMMKSIIQSNATKESKACYIEYGNYIKKNGHQFKPKKMQSTLSHKVEKQQNQNKKEEKVKELPPEDLSWKTAFGFKPKIEKLIQEFKDFDQLYVQTFIMENRVEVMLGFLIFLVFWLLLKVNRVENMLLLSLQKIDKVT